MATHESAAEGCYVALTDAPLDVAALLDRVRSPKAGANVLFAGSTRDNFDGRPVATLCYSAYIPRALLSLRTIAASLRDRHGLLGIVVVHRLGPVPIGEDSIVVAVSAPHRKAAWEAGEACLEEVKAKVEVWKQEVFAGASAELADAGEMVWRANKDTVGGRGMQQAGKSDKDG